MLKLSAALAAHLAALPPDLAMARGTLALMSKTESTQAIDSLFANDPVVAGNVLTAVTAGNPETHTGSLRDQVSQEMGIETWKCWVQILVDRRLLPLDGALGAHLLLRIGSAETAAPDREWAIDLYLSASGESRNALQAIISQIGLLRAPHQLSDASWGRCWHHAERTDDMREALMKVGSKADTTSKPLVIDGPHWGNSEEVDLLWTRLDNLSGLVNSKSLRHWLENRDPPSAHWTPGFRAAILVLARRAAEMSHPAPGTILAAEIHQRINPTARSYLKACVAHPGFVDESVLSHLACSADPVIRAWAMLDLSRELMKTDPIEPDVHQSRRP